MQMSVSLENRCDFVGQRWSEFSFVYEHKELDVNEVISEFARRKNRRLALCL